VGSVLLAGAALAAVTLVTVTRAPDDAVPTSTAASASVGPAADAQSRGADTASPDADDRTTSVELVEIGLDFAPIARTPPDYPPTALEQGLEGHVQLRFDVSAAGVVENVSVVESSDPQFEAPAELAISKWRYLPRITAGKRVASPGIHTVLRFALAAEPRPPPSPAEQRALSAYPAFSADMAVAVDRFAADDLRGAELQLDEMHALYESDAFRGALSNFYGYLYTVQGNYGRAIDAYEAGITANARAGNPSDGRWVPLANLYFARHQYDMALKTLVAYRDRIAAVQAQNPGRPFRPLEDEAVRLYERLRALGVTEETLSPGR
jgi:TonB family protein